jgi:uncharacterized protein
MVIGLARHPPISRVETGRFLTQSLIMTRSFTILLAGMAALMLGCNGCKESKVPTVEPLFNPAPFQPNQPNPKLPTMRLWVGAEELITELALTPVQQWTGMMYRTNMAENEAMLFVNKVPHQASFWMKNTQLPLSAAYIDPSGAILEIRKLEPYNTNSVVAASSNVQYVLETRQGWFERHNIQPGAVIRTERGTLKETFFGR